MNILPNEIEYLILLHVEQRFVARQVCSQWNQTLSSLIASVTIKPPPSSTTMDLRFLKTCSRLQSVTWSAPSPTQSSLESSFIKFLPSSLTSLNIDTIALNKSDFELLCQMEVASSIEILGLTTRMLDSQTLAQNLPKLVNLRKLRATPDIFALPHTVFGSLHLLESVTIQSNSQSPWDTKITVSTAIMKVCNEVERGSMRLAVATCLAPSTNQLLFALDGELPRHDCRFVISSRNKAISEKKQKIGSLLNLCLWLPENADALAKARYQCSKEILKRFLPQVEEKTATTYRELGIEITV